MIKRRYGLVFVVCLVAGCGKTGPLYLPPSKAPHAAKVHKSQPAKPGGSPVSPHTTP